MFTHLRRLIAFAAMLSIFSCLHAQPLLQWPLTEGSGEIAKDHSGNELHGSISATWQQTDHGPVLAFNGTAATQVTIALPEKQRLGQGSWTLAAWVRPDKMGMPESREGQNTRRMFSYGSWPQAIITLNLGGNGSFSCYMAYNDIYGQRVAADASSAAGAISLNTWAHVVMVCDRESKQLRPYVNGVRQGTKAMPANFACDYDVYGNLSFGNGWQNFSGEMAAIAVHREALSDSAIIKLYREEATRFGRDTEQLSEYEQKALAAAAAAAARSEAIHAHQAKSDAATAAIIAGDYRAAQVPLRELIAEQQNPAHFRSYAHLRLAQTLLLAGDNAAARREYAALAANSDYPAVHRQEALELAAELARQAQGASARDPEASRTSIRSIDQVAAEIIVAPTGDDTGDGTAAAPLKSLARARDLVRALRARGETGAIRVLVRKGRYLVNEPFTLSEEDSGLPDGPTVYQSEELGQALFYGGAQIKDFHVVTAPAVLARLPEEARGKVWQADLRAQGIEDYGALRVRGGIGQPAAPPTLELFVDGQPMTLARWPNEGFVPIRELIEPGSAKDKKPSIFGYEDERHARWSQANDPWLFGYWHFLWADATIKIGSIDSVAKTITTAEPYNYGGRGMSNGQGIIYYAFNLLEEIDQPGEWYLDRESGVLYLYPESDPNLAMVEIGMHAGPMVSLKNLRHLRLEGLSFDLGRYRGIVAENCSDCLIAGCSISRMADSGIIVTGGKRFGIFGCDLSSLGRLGVVLQGGDRKSLDAAGHFLENCHIHHFGRVDRTYTQAVSLGGVGNRVSHCLLHDCPTSVISMGGNDHLFEYNDIHSAVKESDDQGGVDMWGNPTFRGNIFRFNRFRSIGKPAVGHAVHGQAAIRFDDAISGQLVYGNILYQGSNGNFGAVQMNSGRDNIIDNNLFIANKHAISGGWSPGNAHWRETKEGKKAQAYTDELYLKRYPAIASMFDDNGRNFFWRNVFWRCGNISRRARHIELFENALLADDEDPGFADLAAGDFRLAEDSPVFKRLAFRQLPVAEMGLYEHPLRASWPVASAPMAMPEWQSELAAAPSGIMPHARALHPLRAAKIAQTPQIDGLIEVDEWPVAPLLLNETPERKALSGPPAEAWLMHDGARLYAALRVPIAGDSSLLAHNTGRWGEIDGMELCLREAPAAANAATQPPILVLQGFPSGAKTNLPEPAELVNPQVLALGKLAEYRASHGEGFWSCEWSLPIAALGPSYTPGMSLQINIGVRRGEADGWLALAGALGPNYQLESAAIIILE
jgi:hypothetical protein